VAEPVEDGFLREIDEELRQENFAKLWKKYGNFIIGGAIVMVASVAGYKAWQDYDLKQRSQQGIEYAAALQLSDDKKTAQAVDALNALQTTSGSGYAMLSQFQSAHVLSLEGNSSAAADAYDRISADSSIDPLYRDLGVILGSIVRMNMDGMDAPALSSRLAQLAADDNPWRHSARELIAVLAEQSGDRAKAKELLAALIADRSVPNGIRNRAGEMLAALGE
jgi:hypothetical protein